MKTKENQCCSTCEYYVKKYYRCSHPEVPQGLAEFVVDESGTDCEFWEAREAQEQEEE